MVPHVMRTLFALVAATLAATTLFPSDPMAYVASGPTWSQPQTPYYVNSANLDLPGLSAETAVRSGADAWQQQSAAFRFTYAGSSSQTTTRTTAINLVVFRNASSGSAIATTYWWSSGSRIIDADIVFWDGGVPVFCRLERLLGWLLHRRHRRARVRARARARTFGIHERDDVSVGFFVQHGEPDAGCRRHRGRTSAVPVAGSLGANRSPNRLVRSLR